MKPASPIAFLLDSLDAIRVEAPSCHGALCRALAGVPLLVGIGPEAIVLEAHGGVLRRSDATPAVEVRCTRTTLVDLIEARSTLLQALLSDRLLVRAAPELLGKLELAFAAYLSGAARSSTVPRLLDLFLAGVAPAPSPRHERSSYGPS